MKKFFSIKLALACILVFMLSACTSSRVQWPATESSSTLVGLSSKPPARYTVLVKQAGSSLDPFAESDESVELINKALNTMAIDAHIEGSLISSLRSIGLENAISITDEMREEDTRLNDSYNDIRGKIKQGADFDRSQLLSLLSERAKFATYKQGRDEARITVAYGLSANGANVGVSAKLSYSPQGVRTSLRCEDEFYISDTSGLEPASINGDSRTLGTSLAKNYHLVRESFQSAIERLSDLVTMHIKGESAIFDAAFNTEDTVLLKTDFVTFDGAYLDRINAVKRTDGDVLGYSVLKSQSELCGTKLYVVSTSEASLLLSKLERDEKKAKIQRKKSEAYLSKFGREQQLRNQDITFKRLGLKH